MIVKCDHCEKSVKRKPYRIKKDKHHFCNKICHSRWMKEKGPRGKNHYLYQKIICNCNYCKKTLYLDPRHYKKSKRHFCSHGCWGKWRSENLIGKKNKQFKRIKVKCNYCGKAINIIASKIKTYSYHFCNSNCFGGWKAKNWLGENHPNWKGGIAYKPYSSNFSRRYKQVIRQRDNFICQLCSIVENGRAHCVHHIDYNKRNSKSENLISLCNSCNSIVNGDRDFWTNYFQGIVYEKENHL